MAAAFGPTCGLAVSIHTPPQGRDGSQREGRKEAPVSIHTPPQGRDVYSAGKVDIRKVSIHTPPQGRDTHIAAFLCHSLFQFTRPRRGAISSFE